MNRLHQFFTKNCKWGLSGLTIFLIVFQPVSGQFRDPSITFKTLNHNFGILPEEGGPVNYRFEFTNNGSEPLVLNNVTSSCGCTIPEWSKEPIPPGASGSILVTFNPMGRPGAFRKVITVKSNAREKIVTLYIVGIVKPRPKSIADDYPIQMGQVRFKTNHLSMQTVTKNQIKSDTIGIYNGSDSPVAISLVKPPAYLSFKVIPEILGAKKKGMIIGFFDGSKIDDWGFVIHKVAVAFNDEPYSKNFLAVSATIEEDFSHLTKRELERAPKAKFSDEVFNFGTIKQGIKVTHHFVLTNEGKDPLIIHKVSTTCGCTVSEPSSYNIPGGGKATIDCSFNSRGKVGRQFHTVTLIMNDPAHPTYMLRVIGTVDNKK